MDASVFLVIAGLAAPIQYDGVEACRLAEAELVRSGVEAKCVTHEAQSPAATELAILRDMVAESRRHAETIQWCRSVTLDSLPPADRPFALKRAFWPATGKPSLTDCLQTIAQSTDPMNGRSPAETTARLKARYR